MQDSTITFEYTTIVDGTTLVTENFERRQLEAYASEFREEQTVLQPELEFNRVTMKAKEAVASSGSNGVRRAWVNIREDSVVTTPLGVDKPQPKVMKIETSIPVGNDTNVQTDFVRKCRAIVNSVEFLDLVLKQST